MYTIIAPDSKSNLDSVLNIAVKIRHRAGYKVSYKSLSFVSSIGGEIPG